MTWFVMTEVVGEMVFRLGGKKGKHARFAQSAKSVFNSDMGTMMCLSDLKHVFSKIYLGLTFIATTKWIPHITFTFFSGLLQHLGTGLPSGVSLCKVITLIYPPSWVHMKATTLWGAICVFVLLSST